MYTQILSCNATVGSCCSDTALANLINIIRIVIEMVQVIAPIILIVTATIQLSKMMMDPDDPKGIKKRNLYNKFIAAVLIFLLPLFANLTLNVIDNAIPGTRDLEVMACFKASKTASNYKSSGNYIQRKTDKDKKKILNEKNYDKGYTGPPINNNSSSGNSSSNNGSNSSSSNSGSTTTPVNENAANVVAYAKSFVGRPYKWGGNDPHTGSDCSGFLVYIFNKYSKNGHRISRADLPNFGGATGAANFTKINPNNAAGGDIVVYSGHYAMLTGNGKEIVHAANERDGVKLSPAYNYTKVLGIYRYKYLK